MKSLYLTILTLFILSCSSTDDTPENCIEYHPAGIETVSPNLNALGNGTLFNVAFRVNNGCGQFGSFEETTIGNVTTIQVIAKYEGCFCTEDTPLRESIYIFNQTVPGNYTLKFKMWNDNYITQTVVIE